MGNLIQDGHARAVGPPRARPAERIRGSPSRGGARAQRLYPRQGIVRTNNSSIPIVSSDWVPGVWFVSTTRMRIAPLRDCGIAHCKSLLESANGSEGIVSGVHVLPPLVEYSKRKS